MPQASLNAMVIAYGDIAKWLLAQAEHFEAGDRKIVAHMRGQNLDLTANYVAEYRHKARNLLAILQAYERLNPQGPKACVLPSPSSASGPSPST